jgi:ABC-type oligopeptide transport system ATPase subunit
MTEAGISLIRVEGVSKRFPDRPSLFARKSFEAVKNVDLHIDRGETLVLVGQSGSGKSTLGRILVRLEHPSVGRVLLDGVDIGRLRGRALQQYRRRVSIIFQNPYRSLNPRKRIGDAIAEPLRVWEIVDPNMIPQEVGRLLESVGLPATHAARLPHELSGGERQRVAIARALSVRPEFMVADEAVSSLDVSAAAEILNLMMNLRKQMGLACLFVTHDLGVARVLADRVAVMHNGQIVETGEPTAVLSHPQHDYTRLLLASQLVPVISQLVHEPVGQARMQSLGAPGL